MVRFTEGKTGTERPSALRSLSQQAASLAHAILPAMLLLALGAGVWGREASTVQQRSSRVALPPGNVHQRRRAQINSMQGSLCETEREFGPGGNLEKEERDQPGLREGPGSGVTCAGEDLDSELEFPTHSRQGTAQTWPAGQTAGQTLGPVSGSPDWCMPWEPGLALQVGPWGSSAQAGLGSQRDPEMRKQGGLGFRVRNGCHQ